jgi:hypothetical protein
MTRPMTRTREQQPKGLRQRRRRRSTLEQNSNCDGNCSNKMTSSGDEVVSNSDLWYLICQYIEGSPQASVLPHIVTALQQCGLLSKPPGGASVQGYKNNISRINLLCTIVLKRFGRTWTAQARQRAWCCCTTALPAPSWPLCTGQNRIVSLLTHMCIL